MRLHSHDWLYFGAQRLEFGGYYGTYGSGKNNKTFMISLWQCIKCDEWKSRATDMQPYLDMRSVHLLPGGFALVTESDGTTYTELPKLYLQKLSVC